MSSTMRSPPVTPPPATGPPEPPRRSLAAVTVGLAFVATGAIALLLTLGVDLRPTATADLQDEYRLLMGTLVVDLRDAEFGSGTTGIAASTVLGEVQVRLPEDIAVSVASTVGGGSAPCSDVAPATPATPTASPTVPAPSESPSPTPTSTPSETTAPTPTVTERTVEVFFSHDRRGDPCEDVFAVARTVPSAGPLRGALEALLAGPTAAERADGYGGWFSTETADLLSGVRIDQARALVSFRATLPSVIPNASSSCGSSALLDALDATVTQFAEVDEGWYDLEGDRAAFYGWLQYAAPDDEPVPPPPAEPSPSPTSDPSPVPAPPVADLVEWTTVADE